MRIKKGFVLREVAGQAMVIATGEASKDFRGIIKLNDTGKEIWQGLQQGLAEEAIVARMQEKYNVDAVNAAQDVKVFVEKMKEAGFLANE